MISILGIWLMGAALAMDCLTVSIATGLASRRILLKQMSLMALSFGVFQGGMTLLGFLGTSFFEQYIQSIDHWIAFGLLSYLGVKMIAEGLGKKDSEDGADCHMLTIGSILTMSVATSIDALAVGISFACMEQGLGLKDMLWPSGIIGFCSTAFSITGLALGIMMGKARNLHAEVLGGLVLIGIGIKILIEHLS